jgi:hypothetical protein
MTKWERFRTAWGEQGSGHPPECPAPLKRPLEVASMRERMQAARV